jgi:hypothetical protein
MRSKLLVRNALLIVTALMVTFAQEKPTWTPDTDWGVGDWDRNRTRNS